MNTKNVAIMALISTLITSTPCVAEKTNPITSMITNNFTRARDWTSNLMQSCWNIGVLATLYAKVGIYDFNKITGLDENKLDTYDAQTLDKGLIRINKMAQYGATSKKLDEFFDKLQKYHLMAQSKEQTSDINLEQ